MRIKIRSALRSGTVAIGQATRNKRKLECYRPPPGTALPPRPPSPRRLNPLSQVWSPNQSLDSGPLRCQPLHSRVKKRPWEPSRRPTPPVEAPSRPRCRPCWMCGRSAVSWNHGGGPMTPGQAAHPPRVPRPPRLPVCGLLPRPRRTWGPTGLSRPGPKRRPRSCRPTARA